jgi:hypothetical protein
MLSRRILLALTVTLLVSASLHATPGCDPTFVHSYHECVRIVDSLRPDKGGQARVFASDGSEYTAGQARWMQTQLQQVAMACVRGDQDEATRLLSGVQELLKVHSRG